MNKNQYRVIFNKARGMMVVVAETALSHSSNSGNTSCESSTLSSQNTVQPSQWIKLNRSLQLTRLSTLCLLMSGVTLTSCIVQAQIIADTNAPKNQQAVILNTANGLPQVNIQTPNAAGVSINTYSQFDVDKSGAVLNNSVNGTRTNLAGWVQGNPLLTQSANIILNEVNSANPSQLSGYLEVAGQRAQVIVANPSGIDCSGCGFINASRATLTTGTPVFNNGSLESYRVTQGTITVDGKGLDGTTADYTDLIAHAVQINAGIWANQLNVITGANTVGAANTVSGSNIPVTPTTASEVAPQFSIDVAGLGGMYAGQITLVGTEAGVGMRNAGQIGTTAGEIVVNADGQLQNSGTIYSKGNTSINTAGVSNSGTLASTQNLTINSTADINNSGTLDATTQLNITSSGTLSNASKSTIYSGADLNLNTSQLNNAGQIVATGTANITAQNNISNASGVIEAQSLNLSSVTGDLNNQSGQIVQTGNAGLNLTSTNLINTGVIGQPIVTNANNTGTTSTGNTNSSGTSTTSTGNSTTTTGSSGSATKGSSSGAVLTNGTLHVAGTLDNTGGQILTVGNTSITTQNLNNTSGQLSLGQLNITGPSFINDKGQMLVTQDLSSQATQFSNQSGLITVGGTLNAQATQIENQKGTIQAGALQLMANQLDNTQGTLLQTSANTNAKITVQGQLTDQNGQIESAGNLNLQVGSLTGTVGQLITLGDLNLTGGTISLVNGLVNSNGQATISGTTIDNSQGQIEANQQITLNANTLTNISGTIKSLGNVNLTVLGNLDNSAGSNSPTQTGGRIESGNALNITVSGLLNNNQGTLGSIGTGATSQFNIQAQSLNNEQGLILQANNAQANNALTIATAYTQQNGQIQTQGNLNLTTPTLTLSNDALTVLGNLNLASGNTTLNNATLYVGGQANLTTADLNNNNGSLTAKGGLNITSSSLENNGGLIQSNGSITILTTGLLNNALLGQILSSQDINVNAQGINNVDGTIAGNNVTINTNDLELENYYGSIVANQNLNLNTGAIANDAGLLQAGSDLNINSNGQTISNTNSPFAAESTYPYNNQYFAFTQLSAFPIGLFLPSFENGTGTYEYSGNLTDPLVSSTVNGVSTQNPTVNYDDGAMTATFGLAYPDGAYPGSTFVAVPDYILTAFTLDNNLIPPTHQIGILSGGTLEVTTGLLSNATGVIAAQNNINLNVAELGNSNGLIQSVKDVTISFNPNANIPAPAGYTFNDNIGIMNDHGKIESTTGNVTIQSPSSELINGLGLISAAQSVNLNVADLQNALRAPYVNDSIHYDNGGEIIGTNVNITANGGDISSFGGGQIVALQNMNLTLVNSGANNNSNIENQDSLIQAGQTLTINAAGGQVSNDNSTQTPNTNLGIIASTINLQNINTLEDTANIYSTNTLNINVNNLWMYNYVNFNVNGNIASGHDLNITAGNFSLSGTLIAQNNLSLTDSTSLDYLTNSGQIESQQGQINIQTNQGFFENDGQIVGGSTTSLNSLGLLNTGSIYSPNVQIETNGQSLSNTSGGTIVAANILSIDSGALTNDSSLIQAGQKLTINTNGQNLTNTNNTATTATNPLGLIASNLQLQNVSTLDNTKGTIYTPNSLSVNLAKLTNQDGNITSDDQLTINASGKIYNVGGALVAANTLQLTGTVINNETGQIGSTTGNVTVQATQGIIDNTVNGQILSPTAITLNSQGLNNGGLINASNIQIETNNQALNNKLGGSITGNTLSIDTGILANDASLIQAGQTLTINTNGQNIYNTNDQNASTTNPLGISATNLQLQNVAVLSNSGLIYTPNSLNLNLTQLTNEGGNITTGNQLNINATNAIDNVSGALSAANAIQLTGASISNGGGQIGSISGDITLNATQDAIDNTGYGQILSPTAITLNGQGLNNGGIISAPNIQIETHNQTFSNIPWGAIVAGNTLSIDSGAVTNNASLIQAGQTLTINTNGQDLSNTTDQNSTDASPLGIIAPNLQLQNVAAIDNSNGIISAQNSLNLTQLTNAGGHITSGDQLTINNTGALNNAGGSLVATNALQLSVATLNNAGGQIGSQTGNVTVQATQGVIDNTAGGKILSPTQLILNSQGLNNGGILYAPNIQIETNHQALNNTQSGSIAANTLSIDTGVLTNDASLIQAGQTLTINTNGQNLNNTNDTAATAENPLGIIAPNLQLQNIATLNNSKGNIYSPDSLNLNLAQLTNQGGSITSGDQLTINTTGSLSNTQGGTLGATNAVNLVGTTITNTGALIGSQNGQVSLQATQGAIDNSSGGQISAATNLNLNSLGLLNNGGQLLSAIATIETHGQTLNNSGGGQIIATNTLSIDSGVINNDSGLLQGNQNLTLNTNGANLTNTNTTSSDPTKPLGLLSGGTIQLTQVNTLNNTTGSISAGGQLTLNANTTQNNSGGLIVGLQNVNINGNTLQNQGGQIEANGTLTINMGGSTGNGSVDNEGLINASTTVITAGTVNNIGGNAKIYGDKVAIGAQTLNNTPANGAAPIIAARQDMELGVQTLNNNPNVNPNTILTTNNGAMILSLGNLNIGGSLDGNNNATGQAQQVNNLSATLQSGGSMNINTANLLNKDVYFTYVPVTQSSTAEDYWTLNSSTYYTELNGTTEGQGVTGPSEFGNIPASQVTLKTCYNDSSRCNVTYGTTVVNGVQYNADNYTEYRTTKTVTSDQLTVSDPALILVGGNLSLLGNIQTTNQNSQIIVGGSLIANLSNLNNIATQGTTTTQETGSYDNYYFNRRSCCHDRTLTTGWLAYNPAAVVTTSQIIGTGSFQPLQVNTASNPNSSLAGNAEANTQQSLANASSGYIGNNTSTPVTSQNASGGTSSQASITDDSSSFANTESTIVQAQSASLIAQTIAPTTLNASTISDAPNLIQPANDAIPTLSSELSPAKISQQINAESITGHTAALNTPPQVKGILATLPNLTLPQIALYQINSSPTATYIVETDPQFLNPSSVGSLASANMLLQSLQTTSNITQKQIGDAFYQQQLVNQQIGALTGQAFISGYNTTNSEYTALLTNGATFAKQEGLTVGVGLTAAQMAQLTSDIVWLVSEPVTLPDGTVENALVPQVYLVPQAGDVNSNGALISANQILLNTTGDVTNSGTIAGEQAVVINANNITNTGNIAGTQVGLTALNDLNNLGGTVNAAQNLYLKAGNDINITTTTQSTSNTVGASSYSQTNIDRIAGLYVSNSTNPFTGGILSISAGNNINLTAADINNQSTGGTTQLNAGNTVNLNTVTTAVQNNMVQDAKNYVKMGNSQDVGTQINSQGNLLINAANQINTTAATLNSTSGTLQLTAKDININSGTATDNFANANVTKQSGFLSHSTITTADSMSNTNAVGSSLGGSDVLIAASHNLTVTGSQVIGDNNTTLSAQNNISIQNATDTSNSSQLHDEKKSGVLSAGSGTIGFTIGKSQQTDTSTTTSSTAAGSTIGSINGSVNIVAGNQYTQTGSQIQTPNGDTDITAQNITIQNAQDVSATNSESKSSQSGLTLAISNPLISAAQTGQQMANAAGQTSSDRMKALAGASAALAGYNANNQIKNAGGIENSLQSTSVSATIGSSKSDSKSQDNSTTVAGSSITAGGNINLTATGGGANSNINIIGSDINAGQNANLKADNQINILSAQDTDSQHSTNSSSSGAIGVAASQGQGIGVTASASIGRGYANGDDVTQVNSHITAGNQANLTSGGDTTIKGGVVAANTINANVGGNLDIESLQDTSTYKSEQQNASGSVTVGAGAGGSASYSQSNIKSDYASVTEQSGLKAGDGGFNVNVKGNTDLTGAVISSTQAAVDQGKNSFSTGGTLTTTDIQNQANYSAQSISGSAGVGSSLGASAGHGSANGNASSVTQSGISGIAGNTAARTGDASTGIAPIFNATKVQNDIDAQTQITQTFSQQSAQAIGTYADNKYNELKAAGDPSAADWAEGGIYRNALHIAAGALGNGVLGAVGSGAAAVSAPTLANLESTIETNLTKAGMSTETARIVAQGIVETTAAGIGSAATGGSVIGTGSAITTTANNLLMDAETYKQVLKTCQGSPDSGDCPAVIAMNQPGNAFQVTDAAGNVYFMNQTDYNYYMSMSPNAQAATLANAASGGVQNLTSSNTSLGYSNWYEPKAVTSEDCLECGDINSNTPSSLTSTPSNQSSSSSGSDAAQQAAVNIQISPLTNVTSTSNNQSPATQSAINLGIDPNSISGVLYGEAYGTGNTLINLPANLLTGIVNLPQTAVNLGGLSLNGYQDIYNLATGQPIQPSSLATNITNQIQQGVNTIQDGNFTGTDAGNILGSIGTNIVVPVAAGKVITGLGATGEAAGATDIGTNATAGSDVPSATNVFDGGTVGDIGSAPKTIPYQPTGNVVFQGNAPVCGPACATMVIQDAGQSVDLSSVIGSFANGIRPTGVNINEIATVLDNSGITNQPLINITQDQLDAALANNQNVIVNVNGHFIIIDSEQVDNGVSYYMTRDPWSGPKGVRADIFDNAFFNSPRSSNAIIVGGN